MLSELLPHFLGRRGRWVSDAAQRGEGSEGLRSFTQSRRCCASYTRQLQRDRSRIDMKKLDLKSNCATSTPYIVLRISHN